MEYYAQVLNDRVVSVCNSPNQMVPIDSADTRLLNTRYDASTGKYIGYNIALSADKTSITADGTDKATITATITSWDGTAATNFATDIIFEVNGKQTSVTPSNGTGTFEFTETTAGTYEVKTVNPLSDDIIKNDSISITAQ